MINKKLITAKQAMKTGPQAAIIMAAISLSIILITGAIAGPVEGAAADGKKSAPAGGARPSTEVTWKVASNSDAKVPVVAMGLSKVIPVMPGFSLVWVNDGYAASDYGPYNRLFLVYHSKSEMPHYNAVFSLGNIHSVDSVKSLNEHTILVETDLHAKLPRAVKVRMVVDLAELNAAIKALPEEEGNLDVSVKVTVSKILKDKPSTGK